ncbi:hypothetical protein B0G84_9193 [Paraburkholderia sp. BL8N3]|nr:hypothetical protein [Paraburkholderia sp. BL8N3]TCK32055.1 hypothetical protein B0G84_9193 [Paraburkholderia sp. BL8N3]
MAQRFKRGQAVMYFEGKTAKRCYFGGKMGAYRVLSSVPEADTGWAVPLSEVDRLVFPAPGDDGSFDRSVCEIIQYRADRTFFVRLQYVQAGPSVWAIGYLLRIGDTKESLPVVANPSFPTYEEAVTERLAPLLRELSAVAAGVPNSFFTRGTISATMQRRAHEAIYALLSPLPARLHDNIVIALLERSGDIRG